VKKPYLAKKASHQSIKKFGKIHAFDWEREEARRLNTPGVRTVHLLGFLREPGKQTDGEKERSPGRKEKRK